MEIDTIKISELAEGTQINNDSILVYNLNGQTKKISFQNLKNAVISALASEVSQLDADLDAEVSARTAADTTLAGDISAEADARAAADTSLAGDISAEAAARTAADTALSGDISAEATARAAADTAITDTLTGLIKIANCTVMGNGTKYADNDVTPITGYKAVGVVGYDPSGSFIAGYELAGLSVNVSTQKLNATWGVDLGSNAGITAKVLYVRTGSVG